jgi:hypothetical protein
MSWANRVGKGSGNGHTSNIKIVEEENDFPIEQPNFMRIGSAHAAEHSGERQKLAALLEKFVQAINVEAFGQEPAINAVELVEK